LKPKPKAASPLKAEPAPARFLFGGQDFTIVDRTALHWPAQSALLVADLHLEKGSWFAERGQMLPPYDSLATLDRLIALVAQTQARTIWALGDNFHDSAGPERMAPAIRARLDALLARVDLRWITGNHDDALADGLGGTILPEDACEGLILRHRADPAERGFELSGHWHPKLAVSARGRRVTRPCFVRSATRLILPAFGAYTGGMAAHDPAIMVLTGPDSEALLAGPRGVARFPLG
jgi:hypothetical protein